MGVITVREFNANVSQALARAEAGEILSITKNGKPIAEMRPVPPTTDVKYWAARARLQELMKAKFGPDTDSLTYEDKHGPAQL